MGTKSGRRGRRSLSPSTWVTDADTYAEIVAFEADVARDPTLVRLARPDGVSEALWQPRLASLHGAYRRVETVALAWRASALLHYRVNLVWRMPEIAARVRGGLHHLAGAVETAARQPLRGTQLSMHDVLERVRLPQAATRQSAVDRFRDVLLRLLRLVETADRELAAFTRAPARVPWPRKAPEPLTLAAYEVAVFLTEAHPQHVAIPAHVLTVLLGHGWAPELLEVAWGAASKRRAATSPMEERLRQAEARLRRLINQEAVRRTGRPLVYVR
jgi:hypothetical protein